MSHVTTIDLVIKDLKCLEKAAKSLGLEFKNGQKTYKWWGHHVGDYPIPEGFTKDDLGKCDHAVGIPGNTSAYEIGVVGAKDGTYKLIWDFYGGGMGLQQKVGDGCGALCQQYSKEVTKKQAMMNGYTVQENKLDDGSIELTLNI